MKRVDQDSFAIESNSKVAPFDFDAWQKLAQSDPDEFELKRRVVLDGLVEKMHCRDDSLIKALERIEQQRSKRPAHEVLPWMMKELGKAFKQLNEEFTFRANRWPG